MAVKLTSTRDAARINGLKILVYGAAGAGKTTLCATTGAPTVIISAEAGLLSLRSHDIPVIEVSTIDDVKEAYSYLAGPDGARYQWVCLDSISEIAEVVLSNEKANKPDPRQAYGALADIMGGLVRAFRDLAGKHVLMTAKMEKTKDEVSGGVTWAPSMPGQRVGQQLPYWFDEVFVLRVEKDSEGNPSRWLQTGADFNHVAKDRSGALEQFEAPNLAHIAARILTPATHKE